MRIAVALLLTLTLAACQVTRPETASSIAAITPQEAVDVNSVDAGVLDPVNSRVTPHLKILSLSGGGVDGAWSAGILNGWTEAGTRPKFDVVAGVSTGALVAVLAFLGPDYDPVLKRLYTEVAEDDIFKRRGITGLLGDSIFDNAPLKRMIEREVTAGLLDKVATEHRAGRRLYVATVNLDAGETVVWNMGALAAGERGGRTNSVQTFQKILRASAAIPVFFPPVYLKPTRGVQLRQAHVDGGIKTPVILSDFLFKRPALKRDLYVIVNGQLALEDVNAPIEANLKSIAGKTVSSLTRELMQQTLYRGYVRSQNTGTNFRLSAIPNDIPPPADALTFEAGYLQRVYDLGRASIKQPGFWQSTPPTVKQFDRVTMR
ncbi:patatin-like phospholipase family protein [Ahrensia sp. R2A130]|uniref:patatin-like phospholipase family protein n=1 Tax=Ahrensia sp. R2A130 TaxID=744979 RepID=UPI0001E09C9A|nr:patatin-like phospholipase family protein [Ahrensia sp. R2A130]EFL88399.1 patatin [Ahrensia sp. R2A130]